MRGTTNRTTFEDFVKATSGFPPAERNGESAQDVFRSSYKLLGEICEKEPKFWRAKAWRAYALALTVSEGWPLTGFPEDSWSSQQRLDEALRQAEEAKNGDDTDHDLWWALANIHLIRREFPAAKAAFDEALYLNSDESNPNLFAEAADAMVHLGNLRRAEVLIRKALRKPDWHPWIRAWTYFIEGGRNKGEELFFLDHALDQIKSTRGQPGDAGYLLDIQLLLGVVHTRRHHLLASSDPAAANKNRIAAQRAMRTFLQAFPYWDVEQAVLFAPFSDSADAAYWRSGCEEAWAITGQAR